MNFVLELCVTYEHSKPLSVFEAHVLGSLGFVQDEALLGCSSLVQSLSANMLVGNQTHDEIIYEIYQAA